MDEIKEGEFFRAAGILYRVQFIHRVRGSEFVGGIDAKKYTYSPSIIWATEHRCADQAAALAEWEKGAKA